MSVRPEVVLLGGAAGVGLLALLFPLLLRERGAASPVPWGRLALGFAVLAVLFGVTRLRVFPFAPGGTLGDGLAIGGALGLLTWVLAACWTGAAAGTVGAGGGALLGGAIVLLWHRGYPDAALAGFGAGHAVATLLMAGGAEEPDSGRAGLWAGPVLAAILAGAMLLAIDRASDMGPAERLAVEGKVWWVWPAAVLAAVLAGQMVGLSLFARRAGGHLGAGIVAALLLFLLWLRFPSYGPLMAPPAAGFVTALLLLGCTGVQAFGAARDEHEHQREPNARTPERPSAWPAFVAPVLVVVLLATAYRLYAGYGIALAALGAAALLPWLVEREPRAVGHALFGLLAAAVLFRVYYGSYGLRGSDLPLSAHYTMISLIAGAMAPFALALLQAPGAGGGARIQTPDASSAQDTFDSGAWRLTPGASPGVWRLASGVSLIAAVALPVLLTLFWGQKAGGGLLLGVVIGQAYRMLAALLEGDRSARAAAGVPEAALLVMGWVTVQLLDRVEAYGLQMLRVQRVGLVAAVVAACLILLFLRPRRSPGWPSAMRREA